MAASGILDTKVHEFGESLSVVDFNSLGLELEVVAESSCSLLHAPFSDDDKSVDKMDLLLQRTREGCIVRISMFDFFKQYFWGLLFIDCSFKAFISKLRFLQFSF